MTERWMRRASVAGIAVGVGLLVVVLARVRLGDAWRVLAGLDAQRLGWPLLLTLAGLSLRAWRWRVTFPRGLRPTVWASARLYALGGLLNNVLPARGGDLVRCALVRAENGGRGGAVALATVGVEKVLDGLMLLLAFAASLAIVTPPRWYGHLGGLAALLFGGALGVLLLLRLRTAAVAGVVRRSARALGAASAGGRAADALVRFVRVLEAAGSMRRLLALGGVTVAIWVTDAAVVAGLARALDVPLSAGSAIVVSSVVGLGLAVPTAPGFIGTYEFSAVAALSLVGVGPEPAFALAVLMHAWLLLVTTVLGLVGATTTGTPVARLVAAHGGASR